MGGVAKIAFFDFLNIFPPRPPAWRPQEGRGAGQKGNGKFNCQINRRSRGPGGGVKMPDKIVYEGTEQRKKENSEYRDISTSRTKRKLKKRTHEKLQKYM